MSLKVLSTFTIHYISPWSGTHHYYVCHAATQSEALEMLETRAEPGFKWLKDHGANYTQFIVNINRMELGKYEG